jgi:hypothetical protein
MTITTGEIASSDLVRTVPVHYHAQELRAAEWYGLRPSGARICPRVVAGKHCLAYRSRARCVCQRHRPLLDHARIWLDTHGRHILTGEPYGVWGDDVMDLLTDLAALGLRASFTAHSVWNPGSTLLIRIERADSPL